MKVPFLDKLIAIFNPKEIVQIQPIDISTSGAITEAKLRAEFYGEFALLWIDAATKWDSPVGESNAAMDARLAFHYANIAYTLEHERFAYMADSQEKEEA